MPTFWPWHLFKFNSNNGPSPGHSNLGSDGRYTYSSLPLMVWWVPYLNKGCRSDFNNGLGGDSNSGPVLAPSVYLRRTRIMVPPQATPVLCQMKSTSVQVSYLWFPGGGQGPHLNGGLGNDSDSGCIMQVSIWPVTIPPGHPGAFAPKCVPSPGAFAQQKMPGCRANKGWCPWGRAFVPTGFQTWTLLTQLSGLKS